MNGYVFSVGEENKSKAYKELMQELKQELDNKPKAIENMEIEYFKKYMLNEIDRNDYKNELEELRKKIEKETESKFNLQLDIEALERRFKSSYSK